MRNYTKRTKEERYNAMVKQIEKLEAAHNKRFEKIGAMRVKAQTMLNKLTPQPPAEVQPNA